MAPLFRSIKSLFKKKNILFKIKPHTELKHTDVRRLSLRLNEKGEPVRLGGGFHDVYLGNLIFKNGVRKRVIIKRFYKGLLKLDDVTARKYQKVINGLRQIELEHDVAFPNRQIGKARMLPKMGMVKTDLGNGPEWVLVSQAFVKGTAPKFGNTKTVDYNANPSEFTWILLKLGEKGFINSEQISTVTDIFSHHKESSFIPMDIDLAMVIDTSLRKTKSEIANDILLGLKNHIYLIKPKESPPNLNKEYNRLFRALLKHEMHSELKQLLLDNRQKYLIK